MRSFLSEIQDVGDLYRDAAMRLDEVQSQLNSKYKTLKKRANDSLHEIEPSETPVPTPRRSPRQKRRPATAMTARDPIRVRHLWITASETMQTSRPMSPPEIAAYGSSRHFDPEFIYARKTTERRPVTSVLAKKYYAPDLTDYNDL